MLIATDASVKNPLAFVLEKHLEEFLVANWNQAKLGRNYDIYEDESEHIGQQYGTDTGSIDILALSNDKRELLVVELKKDALLILWGGQILRYMGYVAQKLTENGQTVKGIIIAQEDDVCIQRALAFIPQVVFYRYQLSFELLPSNA